MPGSPRPDEDELIARFFRPLATAPGALGLLDDCAELAPPPGHDLVLKTDSIAAGVHFFPDDDWGLVAKKALRVNLSDLAAKGATPLAYLLSLALPADWCTDDLARFAAGLAEDQARYGLSLFGGDTLRSPDGLVVSITVFGAVPAGRMVRRAAARPGDRIFVSGTLGDAALGLLGRTEPARAAAWGLGTAAGAHLDRRYLLPEPRSALAPAVLAHARAAMDLSDGLGLDLARMCRASGVTAEVRAADLPLSPAAAAVLAAEPAALSSVIGGGDDYEILAAVPPEAVEAFRTAAVAAGVPVAEIGGFDTAAAEEGRGVAGGTTVRFLAADGRPMPLAAAGFRHF